MTDAFKGVVKPDVHDSKASWTPHELKKAPDGAPNVLRCAMGWDDLGRYKLFPGGSFGVWLRKKAVEEFHRTPTITFARPPETPTSPDRFGSPERHTRRIEPDIATGELLPK